jgi:hypothetical protein
MSEPDVMADQILAKVRNLQYELWSRITVSTTRDFSNEHWDRIAEALTIQFDVLGNGVSELLVLRCTAVEQQLLAE